jgi:four helix bundle protein
MLIRYGDNLNIIIFWRCILTNSIIADKSFDFAIDIVDLYKKLSTNNKNYVLLNQILRSGTSIGANVKEGLRGQSKKDFLAKMYIALKEADETEYWILLLIETGFIENDLGNEILNKCREISKILNSIIKTTKKKL